MPACSLIKPLPHQMGLQSNQFYELHLDPATRNFLVTWPPCERSTACSETPQKWTVISTKTHSQHQLGSLPGSDMLLCVCVCVLTSQSAACYCCSCPSVWRLKNMFTVFFWLFCFFFLSLLLLFYYPHDLFLTRACFCRFALFNSRQLSHPGTIYLTWRARWNVSQILPSGDGKTEKEKSPT